MNLTVLENRLADFNNTMKGIADNLQYFRELVEKKVAADEACKDEHEAWKKHEKLMHFVFKKGDRFLVKQDVVIPAVLRQKNDPRVVPAKRELLVKEVDCLSDAYTIKIVLDECGSDGNSYFYDPIILDTDQVRKLIENEFIELIEK